MKRTFGNLPIQAKMATIFMVVCCSLVILMAFLFIVDKAFTFRQTMVENHTMLAKTIAINSTAPLIFDDSSSATEVLSAFRVVDDVEEATIYTPEGVVFAKYSKDPTAEPVRTRDQGDATEQLPLPVAKAPSTFFNKNYLFVTTPITLDTTHLGTLTIRANLQHLHSRLVVSICITITLVILLAVLAQLVSARLYRLIASPLMGLIETMNAVTRKKNYSYRVKRLNNDEFGDLTDGFNTMLAEIEKRDEELAKHHGELEELVNKRTKELLLSNQQLTLEVEERKAIQDQLARAQRMEAIGTLAAGVAHDLNNILSGVVSYPEFLLMNLDKEHEMYAPLTTIQSSGNKAAAIVQDLLTLARRGAASMEAIDVRNVIYDYLISAECKKMLANHPGVEIIREFETDLSHIKGSAIHLSKTVMNLITNAAEAIEGRGTITLRLKNRHLEHPIPGYGAIEPGNYVHLQVTDNGHGISKEDQRYIFEPFYTKKKMGISGTGLGMAVVWGTIEDHKGYIDVTSSLGKGTTFDIFIPATEEIADTTETVEAPCRTGHGECILVVDDVREQRFIASTILEKLGYKVETVASGEEALVYMKKNPVDLLVLDMVMEPGIDGLETYRRALKIDQNQRAIIASGFSETGKVESALQLGVQAYLRKPYTVSNLASAVRRELESEEHSGATQAVPQDSNVIKN